MNGHNNFSSLWNGIQVVEGIKELDVIDVPSDIADNPWDFIGNSAAQDAAIELIRNEMGVSRALWEAAKSIADIGRWTNFDKLEGYVKIVFPDGGYVYFKIVGTILEGASLKLDLEFADGKDKYGNEVAENDNAFQSVEIGDYDFDYLDQITEAARRYGFPIVTGDGSSGDYWMDCTWTQGSMTCVLRRR